MVHSKYKALIIESILTVWLISIHEFNYHFLTIGFIEKQIKFCSFPLYMHVVEEGARGYRNKLFP